MIHQEQSPEGEREPRPPAPRRWGGPLGSAAVALGVLLLKAKSLLAFAAGAKWLLLLPKLLLSGASIIASVALYAALMGGLKFALVFVAMILVHELGHYVTLRNMGVPVSLPYMIPGFGAFVAQKAETPSAAHDAAAAVAGPIFGIAAATVCWIYGALGHGTFWIAAAYIGFLLNLFNLIPVPPLDGGRIAGSIDARLWLVGAAVFIGAVLFFGWVGPVTIILMVMIALSAIPRAIAAWRGAVDPRTAAIPPSVRLAIAGGYFAVALVAGVGAWATHPPAVS